MLRAVSSLVGSFLSLQGLPSCACSPCIDKISVTPKKNVMYLMFIMVLLLRCDDGSSCSIPNKCIYYTIEIPTSCVRNYPHCPDGAWTYRARAVFDRILDLFGR